MSEKEEFVSIVPLYNFDSDVESTILENRIFLRRMGVDEINKIYSTSSTFYHPMLQNALTNVKYVLEKKFKAKRSVVYTKAWSKKEPFARNTILALRLLKAGYVNVSCAFLLEKNEVIAFDNPSSLPVYFDSLGRNQYFFEINEVPNFKKLWKAISNLYRKKPYLQFPLAQFTKGFEDMTPEDAIVDYMVAFESLVFIKKGDFPKKGEIIGIAIGMLLGNNQEERTKISITLEKAYSIRSCQVHGNIEKLEKYKSKISQISASTEDYLRCVLRKFIEE